MWLAGETWNERNIITPFWGQVPPPCQLRPKLPQIVDSSLTSWARATVKPWQSKSDTSLPAARIIRLMVRLRDLRGLQTRLDNRSELRAQSLCANRGGLTFLGHGYRWISGRARPEGNPSEDRGVTIQRSSRRKQPWKPSAAGRRSQRSRRSRRCIRPGHGVEDAVAGEGGGGVPR